MNNCAMEIWGRSLDIEIIFDCYADEEILESQRTACKMFLQNASELLSEALPQVEQYCLKNNRAEIGADRIENIFRYVKPKTLFVKRSRDDIRRAAVICAYRFNPDDGLAIVFQNEKLVDIGSENIII